MEFGGYPNHMEYHRKVAIDEYNNARRAESPTEKVAKLPKTLWILLSSIC